MGASYRPTPKLWFFTLGREAISWTHPLPPALQPAEERSLGVLSLGLIPGPSHPWVLHQAHLIRQQRGHGPANLVVGFHFGSGTQQNEEKPEGETAHLLSSSLLAGDASPRGDHGAAGIWGRQLGSLGGLLLP